MSDITQSIKVKNCIEKRKLLIGEENWKLLRKEQQAKYRNNKKEQLGIDNFNKDRADNQKKWYHKNKLIENSVVLNSKIDTIQYSDNIVDNIVDKFLDTIPEKRGRGRPKLTDEQKAQRKLERDVKK